MSNQKNSSNASKSRTTDQLAVTDGPMAAPQVVMVGAWIGVAECTLGLGYGVFLLIRDLMGYRDEAAVISGWGTALWFFLIFGSVLTGAIMLLRGARWGRGPIIMLNLCLLGVAYYMFRSSAFLLALPTAAASIAALVCMFSPKAIDWAARSF